MSIDRNKEIDLVTKLIELTRNETIKWEVDLKIDKDKLYLRGDQRVDTVFTSKYKNKKFRIYKKYWKVEEPDPLFAATSIFGPRKIYPYWTESIILEIIDGFGNTLWSFPDIDILSDLLDEVKYKVSGISEIIEEILKEK